MSENHIIKTINSSDKEEFQNLLSKYQGQEWELVKGTDTKLDKKIFIQVISFDKSKYNHIEYWENGEIKVLGNNLNGKKSGSWTWFDNNVNKEKSIRYKDGEKNGVSYWCNEEGIYKSLVYKDNEIIEDGLWGIYIDNNKNRIYKKNYNGSDTFCRGNIIDGKMDGIWTFYCEEENLKEGKYISSEYTYKDGVTNGISREYYYINDDSDTLCVEWEGNKKNEMKHGKWTRFERCECTLDNNGHKYCKKICEITYKKGKRDGEYLWYSSGGKSVVERLIYKRGKVVQGWSYHDGYEKELNVS